MKQKGKINNVDLFINNKLKYYEEIIHKSASFYQSNKINNILSISDYSKSIQCIKIITKSLFSINEVYDNQTKIKILQIINDEVSKLFSEFGTPKINDLLNISIEYNFLQSLGNVFDVEKIDLFQNYFHPISYNVFKWGEEIKLDKIQDLPSIYLNNIVNFSFYNIQNDCFFLDVYGSCCIISNTNKKESYLIKGFWDDLNLELYFKNTFIKKRQCEFFKNINEIDLKKMFWKSMDIKSLFVLSDIELENKFVNLKHDLKLLSIKSLQNIVRDFIKLNLFEKRQIIIKLLTLDIFIEQKYLSYLLYDLIAKDPNSLIDNLDQTIIYDSFPFEIKMNFKDAMDKTISYTESLNNSGSQKISYEHQIALMKCSDKIKEKANQKLKEIKGKSDDSLLKAKQYLEGLLKIPFSISKREPILKCMETIKELYSLIHEKFLIKKNVTSLLEIKGELGKLNQQNFNFNKRKEILDFLKKSDKNELIVVVNKIVEICSKNNLDFIKPTKMSKNAIFIYINDFLDKHSLLCENEKLLTFPLEEKYIYLNKLNISLELIPNYIKSVKSCLDDSVFGHEDAKNQIVRIIGQWISGNSDGYCFGFEGPPGVGKTSLAKKGIANCLIDEFGEKRPFSMIQLGGDSNGSSLHGHNYTYVGSIWGSIVQILMDAKCMNPIIFIDEIDKVSKTENGKEIIGILTHLLDPSQNDCFQDKYFSGIDLDLSGALFILSYNDATLIDRILLDRIHRVKFNNLSIDEKLVICEKYILPEYLKKMGLQDQIIIEKDVLIMLIDEFTNESGVRKLKELLFNIIAEINLEVLELKNEEVKPIPIKITKDMVKNKYLKEINSIKNKLIHKDNVIGIINGLWANSIGNGGIIPIQCSFYPCSQNLSLKLTGLQGDVMKESMNVALTLAWENTSLKRQSELLELWKDNHKGIHIHCPEGAVPKDGPSAGTAITTAIYSLLNNIKIKNVFGITGEISLDGTITEIGGLELKILGGIKAGIKEFIFPKENEVDYIKIKIKHKEKLNSICFHPVEKLLEVFNLILDYE